MIWLPPTTGLSLHYFNTAKYQGFTYTTRRSCIAITTPGIATATYASLESVILVEAEPEPLYVAMVRKIRSHMVQLQAGQVLLPMVSCEGSTSMPTLYGALEKPTIPVGLAFNAIRPVKIMPLTLDKLVIYDL